MRTKDFMQGAAVTFSKVEKPKKKFVIYLLSKDGEIVYVGKSSYRGYARRILEHKASKDFDEAYVAQVSNSKTEVLEIESSIISMLMPKYNIVDCRFNARKVQIGLSKLNSKSYPVYTESYLSIIGRIVFGIAIGYGYFFQKPQVAAIAVFFFVGLHCKWIADEWVKTKSC